MANRQLMASGECDYDFKYDVLFFKVKNREYLKSIEVGNIVLDIDSKKFLTGIQIFEASKFLGIGRLILREVSNWKFEGKIEGNKIEARLTFQVKVRNKIIEKNPIIIQPIKEKLPNSQLVCSSHTYL